MSGVRRVLLGAVFFCSFLSDGLLSAASEEQRSRISALLEGYPSALSKIIRRHLTQNLEQALVTNDLTPTELYVLWGTDRDKDGYADNTLQWWPSTIELSRVIFQ
ncbi:MAG: hypothetical protein WHS88_11730 [Anaerohalosphaeraceae bacterium]